MSSLPPRQSIPANAGAAEAGAAQLSRFAKRDPALYPLAIVMVGVFATAGYFLSTKAATPDPAKAFMKGATHPWDDESKHDVHPSSVAAFKYRYKSREGHMEDAPPALNQDIRTIAADLNPKFKADL